MTDFARLPLYDSENRLRVVVETPRGSTIKYAHEPDLGAFVVSKFLSVGLCFPADFGFFPSTVAEDGDPLDALIFHETATFPGLVMPVRAIGVLRVLQREPGKKIRNDRIIAVPAAAGGTRLTDARDLDKGLRQRFEWFFSATDELEEKTLKFLGWKGPQTALKLIKECAERYGRNGLGPT